MADFTDTFEKTDLTTALTLASQRDRRALLRVEERERLLVAVYSDGLEIAWQAEECYSYSDVTPDVDWTPPSVWLRDGRDDD
jgi:hypothetical protein